MSVTTKRGVTWEERTAGFGDRKIRYKVPVDAKPKRKRQAAKKSKKAKPAPSKKARARAPGGAKRAAKKQRTRPQAQLVLLG